MAYEVSTPVYEGPFDLLLSLVVRDEVDVWAVSLGDIVDAYLAELDRMAWLDLEVATEFLVIAATLVELKARRLLPEPEEPDDDDLELLSERDLLLARLLECKAFRDAGAALDRRMALAARSWPRVVGPEAWFLALTPDLLAGVTPGDLVEAFHRAVRARPAAHVDLGHVTPVRATVGEVAEEVLAALASRPRLRFRELTQGRAGPLEPMEVVLRFLAVLELFKEGRVELSQASTFGELLVAVAVGLPASTGAAR